MNRLLKNHEISYVRSKNMNLMSNESLIEILFVKNRTPKYAQDLQDSGDVIICSNYPIEEVPNHELSNPQTKESPDGWKDGDWVYWTCDYKQLEPEPPKGTLTRLIEKLK